MQKIVILTTDKNGKPVAYRDDRQARRLIRISYDEAVMMISTGQAVKGSK